MTVLRSWRLMAALAVVALTTAVILAASASAGAGGIPGSGDGVPPAAVAATGVGPADPAGPAERDGTPEPSVVLPDLAARLVPPPQPEPPEMRAAVGPPWSAAAGGGGGGGEEPAPEEPEDAGPQDERAAAPVAVHIPALEVISDMVPLGIDAAGRIEVPADPQQAGWWAGGPEPGERGAAVLLGHVDSWQGPGVFFGLNQLVRGDRVVVDRADGTAVVYEVTEAALYGKDDFPTDRIYDRRTDQRVLRLVTCGGDFDRDARSYDANYVVYAEQVEVVPARTGQSSSSDPIIASSGVRSTASSSATS